MVYGIAKMLNFAHGDVIMVGSYVVYVASQRHGIKSDFSHPAVHYHLYTHGRCDRRRCVSTLRNAASPLAVLITAIGVSYLLQNVALLIWGARYQIIQ